MVAIIPETVRPIILNVYVFYYQNYTIAEYGRPASVQVDVIITNRKVIIRFKSLKELNCEPKVV